MASRETSEIMQKNHVDQVPAGWRPSVGASWAASDVVSLEEALWDGLDSVPALFMRNLSVGHFSALGNHFPLLAINAMQKNSRTRFTKFHIAGMTNTGTNLLAATLALNLGPEVFHRICPFSLCHAWNKHAPPDVNEGKLTQDTLLVQLVRSPLAHIAAWYKAPYGMRECAKTYSLPCKLTDGRTYHRGVTDVWNTYMTGYNRMASTKPNVITVEYEALVLEPEKVVANIASLLNLPLQGDKVHIVGAPSKTHGHPVGRVKAVEKIRDMTYLQTSNLDKMDIRKNLCSRLDENMMLAHEIPVTPARKYVNDCIGPWP
jgi:hypothetical protein